jgi:hypothetical protein
MPPRAADALRGHAPPTGDTGDWPLDDPRVAQFADAVKVRKKVTAAAQLYRGLMVLSMIAVVMFALVMLMGGLPGLAIVGWVMVLFYVGLTALFYVTFRATMRAQRWAPLTMFIVFLVFVVGNIASIALNLGPRGNMGVVVGGLIAVALAGLFAMISMQSYLAIPNYRAQPAWCQELIVRAGL